MPHPGALGELLFEKHTDSKTWESVSVDLDAYAGQSVLLQLETHPGPDKNTTCDRGLWGDMRIVAGNPEARDATEKTNIIALGTLNNEGVDYDVEITTGIRGLLDGAVSFITATNTLIADGFAIAVLNDALESMNGTCVLTDVMNESSQDCCRFRHRFESPTGSFDLLGELQLVDGESITGNV